MFVEVHPECFEFVGRDVVGEFLFENLGVFLGEFRPQFVAFLDLAADRRTVDGGGDLLAGAGLVDVFAGVL